MTYFVTYSSKNRGNTEIGSYETMDAAETAARKHGAIGEGKKSGRDCVYDVAGHEGDDAYGIWIERRLGHLSADNPIHYGMRRPT